MHEGREIILSQFHRNFVKVSDFRLWFPFPYNKLNMETHIINLSQNSIPYLLTTNSMV